MWIDVALFHFTGYSLVVGKKVTFHHRCLLHQSTVHTPVSMQHWYYVARTDISEMSTGNNNELEYLKGLVNQVRPTILFVRCHTDVQLQDKIVQLETKTGSAVSSAVDSAKSAVGMATGAVAGAPRMVLIGPPGAGTSPSSVPFLNAS